jgi:hypothetical protein
LLHFPDRPLRLDDLFNRQKGVHPVVRRFSPYSALFRVLVGTMRE